MKSPLQLYKEAAKQFNVTEPKSLHPRQKIAFVTAQVQELQGVVNRLLFDAARAKRNLEEAKDDVSKGAHQDNLSKFESDLRQMTKTLDFALELQRELEQEYPDVGEVSNADHPDGY